MHGGRLAETRERADFQSGLRIMYQHFAFNFLGLVVLNSSFDTRTIPFQPPFLFNSWLRVGDLGATLASLVP